MVGSGRGRRWGTTQLNRSLFVSLVAQFQGYCRGLHDEAVEVHIAAAVPGQRTVLRTLLTQGRALDTRTPRKATLGADFGRLGFSFIDDLKRQGGTDIGPTGPARGSHRLPQRHRVRGETWPEPDMCPRALHCGRV